MDMRYGMPTQDRNLLSKLLTLDTCVTGLLSGSFVQLFNASKEVGDASNKIGTPEGYTPIRIGEVRHGTLSAMQPITSETVLQRRINVSVSGE
jgi:hypothetical protein